MPVTIEHPALGHGGHRLPKQACFPINSPPPNALAQHLANDSFQTPASIPDQHPLCYPFPMRPGKPERREAQLFFNYNQRDKLGQRLSPRKLVGRCGRQSSGGCGLTPRRGQDTWHILPALCQDLSIAPGPYLGLEASMKQNLQIPCALEV